MTARPLIFGVLNVTPDSFSDGGEHATLVAAVAHAHVLLEAGADWIDIGGESTAPGRAPVGAEEEQRRILPVIRALAGDGVRISVDTVRAATAAAGSDAASVALYRLEVIGSAAASLPQQALVEQQDASSPATTWSAALPYLSLTICLMSCSAMARFSCSRYEAALDGAQQAVALAMGSSALGALSASSSRS